jgi:hypothetical protein
MAIDINIESQVSQTITDGVTDKAPSENAVFDALANKANTSQLAGLVPYTGAVANVDLGTHKLTAHNLAVNHPSGSGDAATITKGGNGEALKVVKSSGSGNAASITGGVTLLDELNLTTKLADAEIESAATWNAKIGGAVSIGQVAFGTDTGVISGDAGFTWDNTNKRLGVGTSTPTARLHVQAQGALSTDIALRVRNSADTQNSLTVNGAGDVYNNGNGGVIFNTFFGEIAGRNATGIYNSGFGYQSLMNTTTGSNNTAFGLNTLRLNTTGKNSCAFGVSALGSSVVAESNTAFGYLCLTSSTSSFSTAIGSIAGESQTTGGQNVAIGHGALNKNTTGSNNSILGTNALVNAIGSNNVCLGQNAGRQFSGGVNLTLLNNSVIIGQDAKTNANNETNQIVIGHNAIGLGSNTAVLGNDSITLTGLKGNVAIGATTASARLDVRAQGALSTDVAFRVRNSANTLDLFEHKGDGFFDFVNNANTARLRWLNQNTFQFRFVGQFNLANDLGIMNITAASNISLSSQGSNLTMNQGGCVSIGGAPVGLTEGAGVNSLLIANGTAPSANIVDRHYYYSADITAGNAAPHFRTENGSVIKLYQETTAIAPSTVVSNLGMPLTDADTFDGYTMKQVVKALRNLGILA